MIDVDALDKEAHAVFFDEAGEFTTTLSVQVGDVVDFSVLKSNAGAAAESYALDSEDYATLSDGVLTATAEGPPRSPSTSPRPASPRPSSSIPRPTSSLR